MDILISNKAGKQLGDLPKTVQNAIRQIFLELQEKGLEARIDLKKLKGFPDHYRLRVGDYRARFEFEKPDTLKIYWIGKRSKAYND